MRTNLLARWAPALFAIVIAAPVAAQTDSAAGEAAEAAESADAPPKPPPSAEAGDDAEAEKTPTEAETPAASAPADAAPDDAALDDAALDDLDAESTTTTETEAPAADTDPPVPPPAPIGDGAEASTGIDEQPSDVPRARRRRREAPEPAGPEPSAVQEPAAFTYAEAGAVAGAGLGGCAACMAGPFAGLCIGGAATVCLTSFLSPFATLGGQVLLTILYLVGGGTCLATPLLMGPCGSTVVASAGGGTAWWISEDFELVLRVLAGAVPGFVFGAFTLIGILLSGVLLVLSFPAAQSGAGTTAFLFPIAAGVGGAFAAMLTPVATAAGIAATAFTHAGARDSKDDALALRERQHRATTASLTRARQLDGSMSY